jgi:hypothetical protein
MISYGIFHHLKRGIIMLIYELFMSSIFNCFKLHHKVCNALLLICIDK